MVDAQLFVKGAPTSSTPRLFFASVLSCSHNTERYSSESKPDVAGDDSLEGSGDALRWHGGGGKQLTLTTCDTCAAACCSMLMPACPEHNHAHRQRAPHAGANLLGSAFGSTLPLLVDAPSSFAACRRCSAGLRLLLAQGQNDRDVRLLLVPTIARWAPEVLANAHSSVMLRSQKQGVRKRKGQHSGWSRPSESGNTKKFWESWVKLKPCFIT